MLKVKRLSYACFEVCVVWICMCKCGGYVYGIYFVCIVLMHMCCVYSLCVLWTCLLHIIFKACILCIWHVLQWEYCVFYRYVCYMSFECIILSKCFIYVIWVGCANNYYWMNYNCVCSIYSRSYACMYSMCEVWGHMYSLCWVYNTYLSAYSVCGTCRVCSVLCVVYFLWECISVLHVLCM